MSSLAVMPYADYKEACDTLREKTGKTDLIKSGDLVAEIEETFEAGSQVMYDAMWDATQNKGTMTNYDRRFCGGGWTKDLFNPKYDIKPARMNYIFNEFDRTNTNPSTYLDLVERCESLGIVFDTSNCTHFEGAFYYGCKIGRLGIIDARKATNFSTVFYDYSGHTIDKLILPDTPTVPNSTCFDWARNLKNITLEGTLGKSGWNLTWAAGLTKASITSFISVLSDTTTGMKISFNTNAVNREFETASGLNDGSTSQEWLDLVATKPNWTIALNVA